MLKTTLSLICLPILPISVALADSVSPDNKGAFEISDFKQGLMSMSISSDKQKSVYNVYEQGDNFQFKPNGSCLFNKQRRKCMWFGISFKTEPEVKSINLDCVGTLSSPDKIGTPEKELGKQLETFKFKLDLKSDTGFFQNPQYITKEPEIKSQTITTSCSRDGKEVLKYQFVFNFDAPLKN